MADPRYQFQAPADAGQQEGGAVHLDVGVAVPSSVTVVVPKRKMLLFWSEETRTVTTQSDVNDVFQELKNSDAQLTTRSSNYLAMMPGSATLLALINGILSTVQSSLIDAGRASPTGNFSFYSGLTSKLTPYVAAGVILASYLIRGGTENMRTHVAESVNTLNHFRPGQ